MTPDKINELIKTVHESAAILERLKEVCNNTEFDCILYHLYDGKKDHIGKGCKMKNINCLKCIAYYIKTGRMIQQEDLEK